MKDNPTKTPQYATIELASARLQLRDGLNFCLQEYAGECCYLIEDEVQSKYYRIGVAEYNFVSLLDGGTTVGQAVAQTASTMGDQALKESEAISICKWLLDTGLATTEVSRSSERLLESFEASNRKQVIQKLNPVTPKIPLFNPDAFLEKMNAWFGWLLSWPLFLVWLGVVSCGGYQALRHWDLITGDMSRVFATRNWLWLGLGWVTLKFFHELSHGVACKKFGGVVRQAGVVLIVLIPLPYVDVTSSWKFKSKWQRIFVAAAGMYCEIFIAAVAAIVWSQVETGVLKEQCFNLMLAGSFTTLVFNANPLMRFDGYYMLADLTETPNLASHGQQYLRWLGKKFLLGMGTPCPNIPSGRSLFVAAYALFAFLWRIIICVALVFAAESMLFGAGIVIAGLAVAMWLVWPCLKLLHFVFVGPEDSEKPGVFRFCLLTTGVLFLGWFVFHHVPWYSRIEAPAMVDFQTKSEIRTAVSGFVDEVLVEAGQTVQSGDVLIRLVNHELDSDISEAELQIQAAFLRARVYKQPPRQIAAYEAEMKSIVALEKRVGELRNQAKQLMVRAPHDGQVIAEDLYELVNTHLPAGRAVCVIGTLDSKKVNALITQHDFKSFESRTGETLQVHIWGYGSQDFEACLERVNPRAQLELPNPAFGSVSGGPLAVRYRPAVEREKQGSNETEFELVEPRFLAQIELPANESLKLHPGQLGFVSFRTAQGTFGEVLCEKASIWLRKMREQNSTIKR